MYPVVRMAGTEQPVAVVALIRILHNLKDLLAPAVVAPLALADVLARQGTPTP